MKNNEKKCSKIKTDILYIAQNLKHNIIRSFLGVWELIWQKNAKKKLKKTVFWCFLG